MLNMKRLPLELTDRIIDFHHKDFKDLEVCSLVCRDWLPASRYHRFGRLDVSAFNVRRVVKFLLAPLSTIARFVHTLHITQFYTDAMSVFDTIVPYLGYFAAIQSITVSGSQWVINKDQNHTETQAPRGLRIGYPKLTCDFLNNRFILTFSLNGLGSTFQSYLDVLRSVLDGSDPSLWLPRVVQLLVFKQVDFDNVVDHHLPTVQATLKSGVHHICSTLLKFDYYQPPILTKDFIDLTHNTRLHELCILEIDLKKVDGSLCEMIQQIPSRLKYVQLSFRAHGCTGLDWLAIEKAAGEFNHPRFSELEEVYVVVKGVAKREADAWVREALPRLDNRNILDVVFRDYRDENH